MALGLPSSRFAPGLPRVDELIVTLTEQIRATLGERLVGIYLYGSLTTGAFDDASDIDLLVVTDTILPEVMVGQLRDLHQRFASGDSVWATEFEVSYIPKAPVRRYDGIDMVHPRLDRGRGEKLYLMSHDSDWVVQRHLARELGVALVGPPPDTLIDPVTPNDMRRAMRDLLRTWNEALRADATGLQRTGDQSYRVLSLCRILFTLEEGKVASKPAAARWAMERLESRWCPLIVRALAGRQKPEATTSPEEIAETLEFIRFVLDYAGGVILPVGE